MLKDPAAWNSMPMKQHILPRLMRRFAAEGSHADYLACTHLLNAAPSDEHRKLLVGGFEEAFKGRSLPPLPAELADALAKSGAASPLLRVRLGDPQAIDAALKIASDPKAKYEDRLTCTALFGEVKTPRSVPVLVKIAGEDRKSELRKAALTALLLYEDESIGSQVAEVYPSLPADVRPSAMNLMASRPAWSLEFFKLIESGTIKPGEVPADVVMRLRSQQDAHATASVQKLFPISKPAPKTTRMTEVARVRSIIGAGTGDPYRGEATFLQRCAVCHTLFHKGGNVGPNLTSYQRDDLSTMLISIVDPSAEIREGFQNYLLKTKDGRTLSGFLSDNDAQIVALRGLDGQDIRVPRTDIAKLEAVPTSLMPEGLLEGLSDQEMRDFFAYLRMPQPISR
jgi:putative heme-binding domain-containing protein